MKAEATASIGAAAVSALAGTVLGIPVSALIAGFCGGLAAVLLKRPPDDGSPGRLSVVLSLAAALVVAVLCAGFAGPFTAAWLHNPSIDPKVEILFFSFLWGAGAQAGLLMSAIGALQKRIDRLGGGS